MIAEYMDGRVHGETETISITKDIHKDFRWNQVIASLQKNLINVMQALLCCKLATTKGRKKNRIWGFVNNLQ